MTSEEAYRAGYQAGKLSMPEITRCKDCKNRYNGCCYNKKSNIINFGVYVADDWYCADGELKDGDGND